MPEAPVHEDSHAGWPEDNVGRPPHADQRLGSHPIAKSPGMEQRAEATLGSCIPALDRLHIPAALGAHARLSMHGSR